MNSTHPRKMVKMKKYSYWNINSGLEVIWPENLKFCILDHVRPSVNCKLSPPTRNGQMKKSNYRDTNLDPGVTRPSFSITNWVRLWGHQFGSRGNLTLTMQIWHPRPRQTTRWPWTRPPTQNGRNEIIRFWGHRLRHRGNLTRTIQILHSRPRQTTRWPWTKPTNAQWSKWNYPFMDAPTWT